MSKIENYLGIANYDIQIANNSQELKSYVASILCENDELQQENNQLKAEKQEWINLLDMFKNQQKEFIEYLKNEIYSIEPKGTGINYNCEYDSEEDYINAMKEQSKLNTFKEILSKYKEIIGGK